MSVKIINDNALDALKKMPDESCHTCLTSPPYWRLRDYGVEGQLGLEKTQEEYVEKVVEIFREVRRVLRNNGTLWLNLGDVFAGSLKNYKSKDLVGIPWMIAFALRDDGWYLRSDIIWSKPNPMPESVRDRPTKSHEYIFLMSKSPQYFYDWYAVAEECVTNENRPGGYTRNRLFDYNSKYDNTGMKADAKNKTKKSGNKRRKYGDEFGGNPDHSGHQAHLVPWEGRIRNKRSVWEIPDDLSTLKWFAENHPETYLEFLKEADLQHNSVWNINTKGFPGAHFATFPEDLIIPCIKAGTSEKGCCPKCKAPWKRIVDTSFVPQEDVSNHKGVRGNENQKPMDESCQWNGYPRGTNNHDTIGWEPSCDCGIEETVPCTVLDCFGGAGTTALVSDKLGRNAISIELSPEYVEMQYNRINDDCPLFAKIEVIK